MYNIKRLSAQLIIIISLAIGFGGGFLYSHNQNTSSPPPIQQLVNKDNSNFQNVDFSLFWKVWDDLSDKYVDKSKLDEQKMVYGAIQGMVNAVGDPYTVFFEPATSKRFQDEISGSFGGVGMEIGVKKDVLTVIAPLPDTPAAKAGILAGDLILNINGVPTAGMSADEAVSNIRGTVGTKVTFTIATGDNAPRDIVLIRATIRVPTVVWKMIDQNDKHIAYVQIFEFNSNVDSAFAKAAQEIIKSNADGLIVDLRNNPGGLLDSSINIAGYMLDKGQPVVSEVYGDGSKDNFYTEGGSSLLKYPTVFLINGGSASASEILAGAVHDNRSIRLIGEKTFGKGSVQELVKLDKGASLKVTIAKWFTPAGINISDKGIEPDISVVLTDQQKTDLVAGDPTKDPQLQKALDALK